jgi:tetratricopeptide (TPR) repeat protein
MKIRAGILAGLILMLASCSTEKDRWINKGYHNMTARYNGYFNAGETIRLALIEYAKTKQENYFEVLPVRLYPGKDEAEQVAAQMEIAIKKTGVVITKHSMPNPAKNKTKREEWCKWIDENWLVMGQAFYYKGEHKEALEKLRYVRLNYPESESIHHADLWIARALIDKGDYGNALALLLKLEETIKEQKENLGTIKQENAEIRRDRQKSKKSSKSLTVLFPVKLQDDLVLTIADLHIRKKEYEPAAQRLEEALALVKKRKDKARLHFILAQIYQQSGDNARASLNYERAMKLSADYNLAFHARIFRALMYSGSDTRSIRNELNKMLKDDKNKDFLDQIYYALGELDMKDGKRPEAIENFRKSARFSTTNDRQKTRTFHRLADIFYDNQKFPEAKAYYDSCLTVATEEYAQYRLIKDRSEGLTDLVLNLNTFTSNDSLLTLVEKGEKHYLGVIDDIIEDFRAKEEARRNAQSNAPTTVSGRGGQGGWYFYNQEAMAFGLTEFRKMWGDRPNEDNWRRKDKSSLASDDFGNDTAKSVPAENDPYSPEFYVKNLPLTSEAQAKAHQEIALSLYNLGVIYRERFNDPVKAEFYFTEAFRRYQPAESCLAASFQLYTLLREKGRSNDAEQHKQFILKEFPKSDYAMIIQDPDFLKKKELAARQNEIMYNQAYALYEQKQFQQVLALCTDALKDPKNNPLAAKYYLLKAYTLGSLPDKNNDSIAVPLQACVDMYPSTPEAVQAQAILDKLRGEKSKSNNNAATSAYVFNADMEHFFVVVFPSSKGSINGLKKGVSDLNMGKYRSKGYKTSNTMLSPETQLVLVKSFANKAEALAYYQAFMKDTEHVNMYNADLQSFVITHTNYNTLFVEKDLAKYLEFFMENYK